MAEPYHKLLLVMRRDLWDMNPGKGMAQACHAGNDAAEYFAINANKFYDEWKEGRTFGVTITLEATLSEMRDLETIAWNCQLHHNFITDPTYPYRNYYGDVYTREEITCMWIFVPATAPGLEFDAKCKLIAPLHR